MRSTVPLPPNRYSIPLSFVPVRQVDALLLRFRAACPINPSLPALMSSCIGSLAAQRACGRCPVAQSPSRLVSSLPRVPHGGTGVSQLILGLGEPAPGSLVATNTKEAVESQEEESEGDEGLRERKRSKRSKGKSAALSRSKRAEGKADANTSKGKGTGKGKGKNQGDQPPPAASVARAVSWDTSLLLFVALCRARGWKCR